MLTERRQRRLKLSPVMSPGDWIGYRHSLANVVRRIERVERGGPPDVPVVCRECDTETDVPVPVHSPRCSLGSGA